MLERSAQWASAVAQLLLLPPGVATTILTHESSACKATVHLGFLAWKLKQPAGAGSVCCCCVVVVITSGQSNVTAADGRFNRIHQVAPVCLPMAHPGEYD